VYRATAGWVTTRPAERVPLGVEAVARIAVHLEMICDLVELFDLRFDPHDPADLWALLALTFGPGDATKGAQPPRAGDQIVHLARVQAEEIARKLGRWIVGDSLVRNAVPVVSIASSSVLSYLVTRRLGDNARRYARYRRAFDDVLAEEGLDEHLDLLIEGVWFIFTADGTLAPEESALLASLVRRASPAIYARLSDELADDIGWVQRLPRIPEPLRDAFLRALEVAAAVDKKATLRERRLLEHAARALGRREDFVGLGRMMRDFRDVGVLSDQT
jgi:hypothetical protein